MCSSQHIFGLVPFLCCFFLFLFITKVGLTGWSSAKEGVSGARVWPFYSGMYERREP